ncbi:MAG: hypothetical protein CSB48_05060 [Proteobacteria bacterium]|nr:MAG: hypothetical protein CSB48_05060 [Pseudomonadota bacterium]PIE40273.1 MAG: hypothetical protein CSA51_01700 [Gammaproteobacteria bacterium]
MKNTSLHKQATALAACAIFSLTGAVQAAPVFSDLYIFGDSLSDTGNVATAGGQFLTIIGTYGENGRFSNGPVWHEYLKSQMGMAIDLNRPQFGNMTYSDLNQADDNFQDPSVAGGIGTNFAYGGALVDGGGSFSSIFAYSYTEQVNYWDTNYTVDSDALYVNWIGGNNIRSLVTNGYTASQDQASIDTALDALIDGLAVQLDNGVTNLLVPNLPDIGSIPEFASDVNESTEGTILTDAWNAGLRQRLDALTASYLNASIYFFDVNTLFDDMMANPASYNITDTTSECRGVGGFIGFRYETECANADTTLFWDEIHPTTASHEKLANYAYDALLAGPLGRPNSVPVPSAALLMLLGVGFLASRRTTKAAA